LPIVVTKGGHFTFRIVNQSPEYNNRNDENPVSDPFLALYGTFNTSDLDSGLVGCNDDAASSNLANPWANGDTFPTNGVSNSNDRWSHFETELVPGAYTAVFTTFIATDTINGGSWSYPQTVTFEYWGPECSIEGAVCASSSLPATGVDEATTSTVASVALVTALAGLMVIVALRRRARD
jgi:LPXTG-motif cell wall-anchored protein